MENSPEKPRARNWLPVAVLALVAGYIVISSLHNLPHAPVGTFIGLLAFVAAVVTIWPPVSPWAKAAWLLVFGAFLVLEISTLYGQRAEDLESDRIKTRQEDNRFAGILADSQRAFEATMRQMAGIARLSKENIDELIGSDSFCYVDILAFPEGGLSSGVMYTTLTTFGIHPLSNVEVRFYDDDARDRIHKSQGYTLYNLLAGSERFSYSYLTAGTSLSPLSSEVWTNTETFKNYSVEVSAKNGSFFELLQIRRDGSRLERAIMVSARYSDGRKGLVYGYIPPDFAADLLKDVRWSWMAKLKHVVVKSVNGLTQPFR